MRSLSSSLGAKKFEYRIYLSVALLVAGFLPALLYAFYSLSDVASQRKRIVFQHSEELILAERLGKEFNALTSLVPVYVLSGDKKLLTQIGESQLRFGAVALRLKSLSDSQEDRNALDQISAIGKKLTSLQIRGIWMKEHGASISSVHRYFSSTGGPLSDELRILLRQFTDAKSVDLADAKLKMEKHTDNLIFGFSFVSLLALLFFSYTSLLIFRAFRTKQKLDQEQEKIFLHETHLSRARKEAVETVAHDLNNPLAAMKLRLQMMQRKAQKHPHSSAPLDKDFERLLRTADSMQRLIQNSLDNAKIESGHLTLERALCRPADLAREVVEKFGPLAANKEIRLVAEPGTELPPLSCDPDRVGRALENLVANAIKFTPSGGSVTVRTARSSRFLVFSVSDTGPGIAQEQLPEIFNRYWQSHTTAKAGTGLGLAIVKEIALAHGGTAFAESVPGKGSDFYLNLPLEGQESSVPLFLRKGAAAGEMPAFTN